jgi:shikimate dehydrogenase
MTERYSFGLIGYPLGHSISPALHRAALRSAGLVGEYQLYEVKPLPEGEAALLELLNGIRGGKLRGLNVTIPHKQTVLPLLDEVTTTALSIGAVNVIFRRRDRLVGDNTDAAGFRIDLEHFLARSKHSAGAGQAVVLGAGGSARAVVYALLAGGWSVTVAARRLEQAQALAAQFHHHPIRVVRMDEAHLRLEHAADLVVNTTPSGMHPHSSTSPWPEGIPLPQHAAVYDLVYNPFQTKLIETALASGLPACSGLGMLVEQAALSFERWTNHTADRAAMVQAAQAVLRTKGAS